jgi:hypothetical protein
MNITIIKSIDSREWDQVVSRTYGRIYTFQQQDGCKSRGVEYFTVPNPAAYDCENETIPEEVNGDEMGVSFAAWLARDPKQKFNSEDADYEIELFWQRNFYPSFDMVANDLHAKGILPAGDYQLVIDW